VPRVRAGAAITLIGNPTIYIMICGGHTNQVSFFDVKTVYDVTGKPSDMIRKTFDDCWIFSVITK